MDKDLTPSQTPPTFEQLKRLNTHGAEFWSARDLQNLLGYKQWRRFEEAIQRAITSCKQSGNEPSYHFAGAGKMIPPSRVAADGPRCAPMAYAMRSDGIIVLALRIGG